MKGASILIVEDEVFIADSIRLDLLSLGFSVPMDACATYDEAVAALSQALPDLVLLDIRLQGSKTGIDLADYINKHFAVPFVFLTSHLSPSVIEEVHKVKPAGFVSKPYHPQNLWANIELAMQRKPKVERQEMVSLIGPRGKEDYPLTDLDYMEADGSYTRYHLGEKEIMMRKTLKQAMDELPENKMVQVHRSFAVNPSKVTAITERSLFIQLLEIPISRRKRDEILAMLGA